MIRNTGDLDTIYDQLISDRKAPFTVEELASALLATIKRLQELEQEVKNLKGKK